MLFFFVNKTLLFLLKVLYQLKFLSKIEAQEYPNPNDVDVLFDVISDVLEKLEIEVNSALIKLIVNVCL